MIQTKLSPRRCLDVYLFVNPLDTQCAQFEQHVLSAVHTAPYKVHVHVIPYHFQKRSRANTLYCLSQLNEQVCVLNKISLFYKAALLQGKRAGRQFLLALQQAMAGDYRNYSRELVLAVAEQVHLDTHMLLEDRESLFVRNAFHDDMRLAEEMHVKTVPTLVLFDCANPEYGLRLERDIFPETIRHALDEICYPPIKPLATPLLTLVKN